MYVGDGIYITSKQFKKLNLVFVLKKVLKAQSFLRSCSTCSYQWPLRSSNRFEFLQENSHLQSNNLSSSPFCFLFQIPEALSFRKISGDVSLHFCSEIFNYPHQECPSCPRSPHQTYPSRDSEILFSLIFATARIGAALLVWTTWNTDRLSISCLKGTWLNN